MNTGNAPNKLYMHNIYAHRANVKSSILFNFYMLISKLIILTTLIRTSEVNGKSLATQRSMKL